MSNPHTNQAVIEKAERSITLCNERFGLTLALRMTLGQLGFKEEKVKEIIKLARERKIEQVEELLK